MDKKKKKNSKRENINYYFQEYNYFENIKSLSNQISFISKVLKFLLISLSDFQIIFLGGNSLNRKKEKEKFKERISIIIFESINSLSNQISFISKVLKFLLIYRYLISRLLTTFPRGNSLNRKKEKFEKAREYQLLFPRV